MRFVSTAASTAAPELVSLADALRRGPAPDGGLYMPERIEPFDAATLARLARIDPSGRAGKAEIGATVLGRLVGDALPRETLVELLGEALDFPIPLRRLDARRHLLELFHGPTLAFKDVGARTLARLLARTRSTEHETGAVLTVLVATSGDTGGAVARAFHGVAGTRVAVLYPRGQVSPLQERQFATLGGNVRAFAVDGTFDDCQRLVKGAFADTELAESLSLTSANSINLGRLLPQTIYYFLAWAALGPKVAAAMLDGAPGPVWSVPSGNFGNLTAGLLAHRLGLPATRFVAATNVNDVVPEYLRLGLFTPRPSARTISNAMDVGDPSNLVRIRCLYGADTDGAGLDALRRDVVGSAHDDDATRRELLAARERWGVMLDPHTAVGCLGLEEALRQAPAEAPGIVLATAHPAKFSEVLEPLFGEIALPEALAERLDAELLSEPLGVDGDEFANRLRDWPASEDRDSLLESLDS